jgi:phospholipid transport system substrate-binding protein
LLRERGEPVRIDWRVRRRDDGYRIVDIVAEGISIAVTLRSEYTSVLKQNGGDVGALVRQLRAVIEAL